MSGVHPALPLFAAAALTPLLRGRARAALAVAAPLAALALLPAAGARGGAFFAGDFALELVNADALARLFAIAFCLAAALSALFSFHEEEAAPRAAGLVLAGAAAGVALAGDWISLFLFWETMTVASLALIWAAGAAARGAGLRYLLMHAAGGGAMLAGLILLDASGAPPAVSSLVEGGRPAGTAGWLILFGAALNAAVPPLHAWLTDAYPACTPSGSVWQSAFTTKAAVYLLLRVFAGAEILVPAGAVMAVYGVVFATMESDARKLLAYHIVSQVGYMTAGAGVGTALAVSGAAAHAFCHILYKALLFMAVGAIAHAAGTAHLARVGGLYPRLKGVFWLYMIGALAIAGAPGLNGFISKPMIGQAAGESGFGAASTLLHLASVGTFLSVALKLPYLAFFGPARGKVTAAPTGGMLAAMSAAAALCLATGLMPGRLYALLPDRPDFAPYAPRLIWNALESMAGAGLAFWLARRYFHGEEKVTLDADRLYRAPLARALETATAAGAAASAAAARAVAAANEAAHENRPEAFPPMGRGLSWLLAASALAVLLLS